MGPVHLLVEGIGINPEDIIYLKRISPGNLNETWRCVLKGFPLPLYVKIQGRKYHSTTISEEAEILELLKDKIPLVPKLITYGQDKVSGKPYLISEELPGFPIHELLAKEKPDRIEQTLDEIVDWLCYFQTVDNLCPILEKRLERAVGVFHQNFNPIENALKFCSNAHGIVGSELLAKFEEELKRCTKNRWANIREIVHGSITAFNLLVNVFDPNGYHSLSGVLDFEATRYGNSMFDVGMLAFYFLMTATPSVAQIWLSICLQRFGEARVLTQAFPFLIYFYLARSRALATDDTIMIPAEDVMQAFLRELTH